MNETYIAALEIGSFKITGAVGVYSSDEDNLKILAVEQEESGDSVRYGIINNPEEVAAKVNRIIDRLNASPAVAPRRVAALFVGLAGRSLHSVASDVKLIFPEETEITGDMLKRLRQDASAVALDSNQEILATVARSYQIDGMETASPKGAMGKTIAAVYDIIVGRSELKRNIQRALSERTPVEIKGMIITPIAAADVVLSDEEKRLGCMLVDFGAETTSVSIYSKGNLCYYATLPLGGRNITRDLTTLPLLEEKAEEIKCESGRAVALETSSKLNIDGVKYAEVSNLVVARAEEIVANVIEQISYAGLKEKDLPAGIICIGGGAQLLGILELLEYQSGLNARMGHLSPSKIQALEPRAKRHAYIQTAAILYAGALTGKGDCLELPTVAAQEEPEVETAPQKPEKNQEGKMKKLFRSFSSGFSNFFASPDDDSELE